MPFVQWYYNMWQAVLVTHGKCYVLKHFPQRERPLLVITVNKIGFWGVIDQGKGRGRWTFPFLYPFHLPGSLYIFLFMCIMRMLYYSVSDTGILGKNPSTPIRSRTQGLSIASWDALPLCYRRLVGAKAIELGSWDPDKHYYVHNISHKTKRPICLTYSCQAHLFNEDKILKKTTKPLSLQNMFRQRLQSSSVS